MKSKIQQSRIPDVGCMMAIIAIMVTVSGCAKFAPDSMNWFADTEATEFKIPDRLVSIWADTVLHQPNQRGVRGFGGRVYFYKDGNDRPIPVDGNVTVYVFDADYDSGESANPLKKYIITAEQLKQLTSKSTLGLSYNLWVPWDEVGGKSRKLNLITRFDGTSGGTVISNSSTKLLPGIDATENSFKAQTTTKREPNRPEVSQASFVDFEEIDSNNIRKSEEKIFSIDLPSSMEQKINTDAGPAPARPNKLIGIDGNLTKFDGIGSFGRQRIPENDVIRLQQSVSDHRTSYVPESMDTTVSKNDPRLNVHSPDVVLGKVGSQSRVIGSRLQSHFGPRRFQAQKESTTSQDSYLLRMTPHPAKWQNELPRTPRSNR